MERQAEYTTDPFAVTDPFAEGEEQDEPAALSEAELWAQMYAIYRAETRINQAQNDAIRARAALLDEQHAHECERQRLRRRREALETELRSRALAEREP